MAHINPAFVIATSELPISNDQDRYNGKYLTGTRPGDAEGLRHTSKSTRLKNMIRSKWKWSWVFNGIIVFALCFLIVLLELDVLPFRPLGYQCNDPSLSHKFKGDTIPFAFLIGVSLIVPLISIFIVEFVVVTTLQILRNSWKKRSFFQGLHWYGQFFLGLLFLLLFVQLAKSLVAEPRPHFFDTCKPDKMNCTGYIAKYKCTNRDLPVRKVKDSYRSFPSGHSALGLYVAVFMIWFFQSRIPYTDYLVVPLLQCIFLVWGIMCALTRITDRRHHWWDVLIGSLSGILMAIFTVKVFCRSFHTSATKFRKEEKKNGSGSDRNSWYRKLFPKSSSTHQVTDKELREVK